MTLSGSVVIHHSSPPAVRHCTQSEHVISPLWVLDAGDTVIEPHTESNRATNPPILNHVFTFPSPAVSHPSMSMARHMHLLVSTVATVWESCPPSTDPLIMQSVAPSDTAVEPRSREPSSHALRERALILLQAAGLSLPPTDQVPQTPQSPERPAVAVTAQ
ncbi:unnamed protein product [Leuciscus chuanchicus]